MQSTVQLYHCPCWHDHHHLHKLLYPTKTTLLPSTINSYYYFLLLHSKLVGKHLSRLDDLVILHCEPLVAQELGVHSAKEKKWKRRWANDWKMVCGSLLCETHTWTPNANITSLHVYKWIERSPFAARVSLSFGLLDAIAMGLVRLVMSRVILHREVE